MACSSMYPPSASVSLRGNFCWDHASEEMKSAVIPSAPAATLRKALIVPSSIVGISVQRLPPDFLSRHLRIHLGCYLLHWHFAIVTCQLPPRFSTLYLH